MSHSCRDQRPPCSRHAWVSCSDHYRVECKFCGDIVSQCACAPGAIVKRISRDDVCGTCKRLLPTTKIATFSEDRDPGDEDPRPSTF